MHPPSDAQIDYATALVVRLRDEQHNIKAAQYAREVEGCQTMVEMSRFISEMKEIVEEFDTEGWKPEFEIRRARR